MKPATVASTDGWGERTDILSPRRLHPAHEPQLKDMLWITLLRPLPEYPISPEIAAGGNGSIHAKTPMVPVHDRSPDQLALAFGTATSGLRAALAASSLTLAA
jgi:hypothetical protein